MANVRWCRNARSHRLFSAGPKIKTLALRHGSIARTRAGSKTRLANPRSAGISPAVPGASHSRIEEVVLMGKKPYRIRR
jgi:hypothetical protein